MKDRGQKNILTPLGNITFTRTHFVNKQTGETAYQLDRILGWEPHTRISDGVAAGMLETAAQRNPVMREKTQKNKRKIYRSITGKRKPSDFGKDDLS